MAELSRGANAGLSGSPVELSVTGARQGSVDLMVFQLAADRKVRSDNDFVFFNQPASPEGAVRLIGADRVTIDLPAVPAAIENLAVAVAMDDATAGSLAGIAGLAVSVAAGADRHLAPASGLTVERAAVLVEVYRRAGGWKVRNVSAGWAAGLPALAREHGVSVDEAPPAAPGYPSPAAAPGGYPASSYPPAATSGYGGRPPAAPSVDYLPPPVLPPSAAGGYPARPATTNYPTSPGTFPQPGPPPFSPGGWPPPGGSLQPHPNLPPPSQPGGWPPPGGSLPEPVQAPPPVTPGGYPPPGGSLPGRS